jgi:hypothetical protein
MGMLKKVRAFLPNQAVGVWIGVHTDLTDSPGDNNRGRQNPHRISQTEAFPKFLSLRSRRSTEVLYRASLSTG